jgi:predicted PurR-regulated permease PerM
MNTETYSQAKLPDWTARQIVTATLVVVAVTLVFWLVYRFLAVLLLLFIAIVLSTAIQPAVNWMYHRGIAKRAGVLAVYLLVLLVVVGILYLLVPVVVRQTTEIVEQLPQYYQTLRGALFNSRFWFLRQLSYQIPPRLNLDGLGQPDEGETLGRVSTFFNYTGLAASGMILVAAVLLLGFYWTLERDRIVGYLVMLAPIKRRDEARGLVAEIENRVGGYVRAQFILSSVVGVMSLIAYMLIGIPYTLVLAIVAGILEAVPMFGPTLGAIPAIIVALSIDLPSAIWVAVAATVIQLLENYLLVPRVMDESVGVRPMVTLLALATFTSLLGLAGAVLAIPVAAIVQLLLDHFVLQPALNDHAPPAGRSHVSVLRYKVQELASDVRKQLKDKDEEADDTADGMEDTLEAIARDLDDILVHFDEEEESA